MTCEKGGPIFARLSQKIKKIDLFGKNLYFKLIIYVLYTRDEMTVLNFEKKSLVKQVLNLMKLNSNAFVDEIFLRMN